MSCDGVSRREFLRSTVGTAGLLWTSHSRISGELLAATEVQSVPWLTEVTTPPQVLPSPDRPLRPVLPDGIEFTQQAWTTHRDTLRTGWLTFLGPQPPSPQETRAEVLHEEVLRDERGARCLRQLLRYENEPGEFLEGYALRPLDASGQPLQGQLPGIVALHQTSNHSIEEVSAPNDPSGQNLGWQACCAGFIVFCPRNFLWQTPPQYRLDLAVPVTRLKERHPQLRGMGKMLFDAQRAVDLLANLPQVDAQRLGAIGHSLGAKEVLYLQAFDDRIKAGVASEGGIAMTSTNWNAPWYLGEDAREIGFPWQHHQLLALCAPRPLLILAGEQGGGAADGLRSWPYLQAALPAWKSTGMPVRLGLLNHGQGHSLPEAARQRAIEWLRVSL